MRYSRTRAPDLFPPLRPPPAAGGAAPSRAGAAGFTLVELMVTVAIIAILLSMAVPAMQNFLTGRAVLSQAEELVATLRLARSDALRLNSGVTVCAAADTTAASPACASSSSNATWNAGWITFIDLNNNGARDSGDRLLRVQSPLKGVKSVTSDTQGYVRFYANGLPASGAAGFTVQPKLETTNSAYNQLLRMVSLNSAGRPAIANGSGS